MSLSQFWIFLSHLPLKVFGLFTGLAVHSAHSKLEELKLKAEFDRTLEKHLKTAKLDLRIAVLQTSLLYVLFVAALIWAF